MNAQDITIDLFKKNSNIKIGKIFLAIFVIADVIAGVIVAISSANEGFAEDFAPVIIASGFIAAICMVLGIAGLILLVIGIRGKKRTEAYIAENGEDALINEIHNETLYIYARKNKPVTIITRKHIFEIGDNIFNTADIDHAYGYSYRGSTSIHGYTLKNKLCVFAKGIYLNSDDKTKVFQALKTVNPDVLLGFTNEALKEHKSRVKEYKRNGDL